jgi:hypothetical protein
MSWTPNLPVQNIEAAFGGNSESREDLRSFSDAGYIELDQGCAGSTSIVGVDTKELTANAFHKFRILESNGIQHYRVARRARLTSVLAI